jgi:hypothetical protein
MGSKVFIHELKNELLSFKRVARVPVCALFKVKIFFLFLDKDPGIPPE